MRTEYFIFLNTKILQTLSKLFLGFFYPRCVSDVISDLLSGIRVLTVKRKVHGTQNIFFRIIEFFLN